MSDTTSSDATPLLDIRNLHVGFQTKAGLVPAVRGVDLTIYPRQSVAIVGDYDEVAAAIWDFRAVGVSQFLFLGWPDLEEMTRFSEHVLPRLRRREGAAPAREDRP